jgi:hypothetical protein
MVRHERSFSHYQQVLDLEHYLDVLESKPGALAGSSPLEQWRQRERIGLRSLEIVIARRRGTLRPRPFWSHFGEVKEFH